MGYRPQKVQKCDLKHKMAAAATLCFPHSRPVSDRWFVRLGLPPPVSWVL